jgi:hypothetical protein
VFNACVFEGETKCLGGVSRVADCPEKVAGKDRALTFEFLFVIEDAAFVALPQLV